ncbi:MAG: glycosyltransferase [Flavobacterium sp.]|nr:glycosyltransferase [Flavobacterium sp.]
MVKRKKIIASYHHSFAGGSKNTSRLLHFISKDKYDVDAYFYENPQFFDYTKSKVKIHVLNEEQIHSDVIESSVVKSYSFTNRIIEDLDKQTDKILFGINLFPYCNTLLDVKSQTQHSGKNTKLILHPVGSDIWQIGPQIKSRVKWLLDNPLVDSVITYSESFITEIKDYYGIKKEIQVLPPVLEPLKFFPLNEIEITTRKKLLGFNDNNFIIHHHSSMRRIKCPESIIEIAVKSSQIISNKCILIMSGTVPYAEIKSLNLQLERLTGPSPFIYKTQKGNLTIYWTGVVPNVEYLLQIADVELNASLHDSFNIALMEAMACAVPVVTSDVVGIGKHIIKADAGYCFPTKKLQFDELNKVVNSEKSRNNFFDIDYAVSAVVSIANKQVASQNMGVRGANYVVAEFNPDKIVNEFYKLI